MATLIETFNKRWRDIESETLSAVRRSLKTKQEDLSLIDSSFRRSCDEWFSGNMAAALWFEELSQENPDKANKFRSYAQSVHFRRSEMKQPATWLTAIFDVVFLGGAFAIALWTFDWEWIASSVFAIAIAIIVNTISQIYFQKQTKKYVEDVVDTYREQLKEYGRKLSEILNTDSI